MDNQPILLANREAMTIKKWSTFFILSTIIISLAACKKKNLNDNGTVSPGSNLVTKTVYEFQRGGINYATYRDYFYDQSNRVAMYREYQVEGSLVDTIHIINFSYTNNDSLPVGSVEKYLNDWDLFDIVEHQYSYDNQKRIVLDSVVSYNNTVDPGLYVSRRMEYHPSYIVVHDINFNRNSGLKEQFNDSVKTDVNGNAVATRTLFGTSFLYPLNANVTTVGYMYQSFSYSSVPNIFNNMNVKNVLAFVQTGQTAGHFYSIYLGNQMISGATFSAPGLPGPYPEAYSYTSNPSKANRVEKISATYVDGIGTGTIIYK